MIGVGFGIGFGLFVKNRFQLWLKMKSGIMFLADVVKATNFVREIIVCFRNNFRLR